MLNQVQHFRLLNILKPIFKKRANWNKDAKKWLEGFEDLNEEEQEELLTHFYRCQADTIIKKMNSYTTPIHVPYFGNFTITAQQMYCLRYKEELKTHTGREKQDIMNAVFGTYKPISYNPCEHEAKLSIDPSTAKRKANIF